MNQRNYFRHEFKSGLRLIHLQTDSPVAHCGVLINVGSRDESPEEEGLAHFIEHLIFKGTKKRKAYHILSRMEDVGGEINAYTGKEETCLYASFLREDYGRTLELFSDLLFHSTFPEKELEKEKDVVIEEILSYLDAPSELIFDDFQSLIFPNHPMGANILGTKKGVKKFTREQVLNFVKRHYHHNRMVIASIGNISPKRLINHIEKHFESQEVNNSELVRQALPLYQSVDKELDKNTYQTHAIMGGRAYAANHKRRSPLVLLNNLLGGPGMNTRLNMNVREKYGFTYTIESFYSAYTDCGEFGIYFGTDKGTLKKSQALVLKELKKLRTKALGPAQLTKAKKQLLGQIAIAQENAANHVLSLGKSLLFFDKVDDYKDIRKKIDAIDASQLMEVANEVFDPEQLSSIIYKAK